MSQNNTAGTAGTTDERTIEARMPKSIKTDDFTDSFGRTFACPECGAPSTGTCPECGYTHAKHRSDASEGGR